MNKRRRFKAKRRRRALKLARPRCFNCQRLMPKDREADAWCRRCDWEIPF